MQLIKKTSILYIILIIVLLFYIRTPSKQELLSSNQNLPQEYMRELFVTHFTESGTIKDRIIAKHWSYLPDQKSSFLNQPSLSIIKPNGSKWNITANHAKVAHQSIDGKLEKLEMWDNVIAKRPKESNFEPITVKSEQMSYYPDEEKIMCDKHVSLEKPGLNITGIGMTGYLNKNWVEIFSNVKTHYASNN